MDMEIHSLKHNEPEIKNSIASITSIFIEHFRALLVTLSFLFYDRDKLFLSPPKEFGIALIIAHFSQSLPPR